MKRILIIGSTGMLGKPVTRQLLDAGFEVTLLARDPEKVKKVFPDVKFAIGNVFDRKSLVAAFQGQDIVYINMSVSQSSVKTDVQPEREGVDNIIEASKEAGIKRIYYLSSLIKNYQGMNGFKWWAFEIKQSAVNKIKQSGLAYTIFYPSTFMETFPFQMMHGNKIMMLGHSVAKMWFIAAEDFGKQVVRSFQQDSGNREYTVQGPEPFTFDEAAHVFIGNYSKTRLSVMKAPIGIMKFIGNFSPKLAYGTRICDALNKYPEKFESENTWKELGTPSTKLADYAQRL